MAGFWSIWLWRERKRRSNPTLWPRTGSVPMNWLRSGSTRLRRGALASMASVIPVSWTTGAGTGRPGLTRVENSPSILSPRKRTAPISMMASEVGSNPVVSRSSATIDFI